MRPRPQDTTPRPGFGSIRADELLPLREVGRRLGWGNKTIAKAQRDGLRTVAYGKLKYVAGAEVLRFFAGLAHSSQAADSQEGNCR